MALLTTPEKPAPVRQIASLISGWIDRLGAVWVDGQIAQLTRRPGLNTVFITLRDPVADISVSVTCSRTVFDSTSPPPVDGARVVVHAKPSYYANRGGLSLMAREIRPVGLGDLLARIEQRRRLLAAEGLFAAELKRPLPFLPRRIGLVTAPGSAAERDVVTIARSRWPAVRFETAPATMQGSRCVGEVIDAMTRLAQTPEVEVIVIARGGGSVEDLLPFSDETLIRAVHKLTRPVVSAIGHDQDAPLLDLVADVRAATPTDAAKLTVPDVAEEATQLARARHRLRLAMASRVTREQTSLDAVSSRPVLARAHDLVTRHQADITSTRDRMRRAFAHRLDRAQADHDHQLARLRTLSPAATLDRGYAVVTRPDGRLVSAVAGLAPGTPLTLRLRDGRVAVSVAGPETGADHE